MSRPLVALIALSCALTAGLLFAGCGSSGRSSSPSCSGSAPTPSKETLQSLAGHSPIAVVPGTEDFQPGRNRFSFLIIDSASRAISTPIACLWVSTGLRSVPYERTVARSERIGVAGGAAAPVGSIYVAHVDLPRPGKYWILAVPAGSTKPIAALANAVVPATRVAAPRVGDQAVASRTPTLASTSGGLAAVSTSAHPDPRLYRLSVAGALAAHSPFVVTFATPRFCTSRTCGPVVDVVDAVAKKLAATPVRFIHVEIYEGNDPAKGFNRWVKEWNLPTEPFTFVVDRSGVIRAKLEGAFSVSELESTVRSTLLSG
ncbi:MAG: hypothetical protein ABI927_00405 [Gaiellaceae bacterium]